MSDVLRDITDARARNKSELDALYRKIVSATLLQSGMGSPTDIQMVREATAALESVYQQTELGAFLSCTKAEKERQVADLTAITSGIRLFNRSAGKGGQGIPDRELRCAVMHLGRCARSRCVANGSCC